MTTENSRALILPKELLELYRFGEEVSIEPTDGGLIIRPARTELTFEEAKARIFREKCGLLERLIRFPVNQLCNNC